MTERAVCFQDGRLTAVPAVDVRHWYDILMHIAGDGLSDGHFVPREWRWVIFLGTAWQTFRARQNGAWYHNGVSKGPDGVPGLRVDAYLNGQ